MAFSRTLAIAGLFILLVPLATTARAASEEERSFLAYRQAREEGRPFDGVILDLTVKDGWGGERTLVVSGSLEGPREHYRQRGFRGVLGKPYSLADLRRGVEAALLAGE